jgi:glucokinase
VLTVRCWAALFQGGHTDWPPRDEEEFELLQFLRHKHQQKARVSVERVISGPGIASIYEFLAQKYPEQVNQTIQGEFDGAGSLKGGVCAPKEETKPPASPTGG